MYKYSNILSVVVTCQMLTGDFAGSAVAHVHDCMWGTGVRVQRINVHRMRRAFSVHANSARTGLMGWPSMVCDGIANGLSFATLIKKRPERCRKRRIS